MAREIAIARQRGRFGVWQHVEVPDQTFARGYTNNLRSTLTMLRLQGFTIVHIRRGGRQRPRYETRKLS